MSLKQNDVYYEYMEENKPMTLREEIKQVLNKSYKSGEGLLYIVTPKVTNKLEELFKLWALEMVGEDYPLPIDSSFAGLNELVGRNWEKHKIRSRINQTGEEVKNERI